MIDNYRKIAKKRYPCEEFGPRCFCLWFMCPIWEENYWTPQGWKGQESTIAKRKLETHKELKELSKKWEHGQPSLQYEVLLARWLSLSLIMTESFILSRFWHPITDTSIRPPVGEILGLLVLFLEGTYQ